jgi:hypothetical protein
VTKDKTLAEVKPRSGLSRMLDEKPMTKAEISINISVQRAAEKAAKKKTN